DGRPDMFAGAPFADAGGRTDSGAAYLVAGKPATGNVDLAADGSAFYTATGAAPGDILGSTVAAAADLHGDGRPDLLAGANGDDRGDLLVGAPRTDHLGRGDSGAAYLLYGFGTAQFTFPGGFDGTVGQPIAPLAPGDIVRTGHVSFSISPALPDGLALDPVTGVISGTPKLVQEDTAQYTVTMTD